MLKSYVFFEVRTQFSKTVQTNVDFEGLIRLYVLCFYCYVKMVFHIDLILSWGHSLTLHSWREIATSSSHITSWAVVTKWRICFNLGKTVAVHLIRRSCRPMSELTLFTHSLPWSMKLKYFGITFAQKLLCNGHMNNTVNIWSEAFTATKYTNFSGATNHVF